MVVGVSGCNHPGHLLVYLNRGTNANPVYAKPSWFHDVVPSGTIPGGCSSGAFSPRFGDFTGEGRLDLVSGSNCCRPKQIHLFQRRAGGSFAERAEVKFGEGKPQELDGRGMALPHLVDWDRDGHTDLVVGYGGSYGGKWTLLVGLGPFADKKHLKLTPEDYPQSSVRDHRGAV